MTNPHASTAASYGTRFRSNTALAIVTLMILAIPFLVGPATSARWHGPKTLAFEIGAIALLTLGLWRMQGRRTLGNMTTFASRGPNLALLALLVLGAGSYAFSHEKAFALQGLLQLAGGILVYAVVAYQVQRRSQYEMLLDALICVTIIASLLGFATFGMSNQQMAGGTFSDHQLLGAFLMLMLPLMLMTSFAPTSPKRRMAAQIASVLCGACLLLARTRASWIGEVVALLILAALSTRYFVAARQTAKTTGAKRQQMLHLTLPIVIVVCALSLFIILSQMGGVFTQRARSLTTTVAAGHDYSFQERLPSWRGAAAMIKAKPLSGWGIGSYTLFQQPFTHMGRSAQIIKTDGPSLSEQAHDFYLQLTAELGIPGLLLWLAALAGIFVTGGRAIGRLTNDSLRQRILIAGLSAVAGQTIDALANPAWQYSEVSLFFWVIVGLSMSAAGINSGLSEARQSDPKAANSRVPANWPRRLQYAATVAVGILLFSQVITLACDTPRDTYQSTNFELDGRYSNGSYTHDYEKSGLNGTHDVLQLGITTDVHGENHRLTDPTTVSNEVWSFDPNPYFTLTVDPARNTATITRTSTPVPKNSDPTYQVYVTFTSGGKSYTLTNTIVVYH